MFDNPHVFDDGYCAYCNADLPSSNPNEWQENGYCDAECSLRYNLRLVCNHWPNNLSINIQSELRNAVDEILFIARGTGNLAGVKNAQRRVTS